MRRSHFMTIGLALGIATNSWCYAQNIAHCNNDWIESANFNETYNGTGPYSERLTTGPNRLTTSLDQAEWQYVGDGTGFSHEMVFNNGVLEVRHDGPGVDTIGQAQYTRAGSYTQRIEMRNVTLNGPIVGLFSVINLFNTIVGGGDNQMVIQNPFGPTSATWQALVLNQSGHDTAAIPGGGVATIPSGTDIATEVWFDEPSRTVRYLYDHDTTDSEPAELVATSVFTGAIDECHRDQQLAITSNSSSAAAVAHLDLDNWSYKTIATVPGDYDGSGVANGADLLFFQQSYGQTGPSLPADGNGDHVVDKFDLDMWETSMTLGLTTTAGAQASQDGAVTAPEPTSVVLLLMSASFLRLRRAHVL